MRTGKFRVISGIVMALLLVCLCAGAWAKTGIEKDEDGGIWNWDAGTYTTPDGRVVKISNGDDSGSGSSSSSSSGGGQQTIQTGSGVIVVSSEQDIVQNPDGSITLEDGQVVVIEQPKNQMSGDEAWAVGMQQAAAKNGTYTPTWYCQDDGRMVETDKVEYTGLVRSQIVVNGERKTVRTTRLIWETEAPEDKVLAVVKSAGYARLMAKPGGTGKKKINLVMDKVYSGTVLRVLDTGTTWTFVDYKGIRGYVLTSQLEFHRNELVEYREGYVATKSGHTYGNSTVHVRNSSGKDGKQLDEYRVGTPISVFGEDGKWCHIEVQGRVCYILREFMVYADEAETQTTAAEDEGA